MFGLAVDLFRSLIAWGTCYPEENFCNAQFSQYCSTKFVKIFYLQYSNAAEGLITFKRLKDYLVLTHSENAQKATRVNQNPLNKDSTEQNVIVLNSIVQLW